MKDPSANVRCLALIGRLRHSLAAPDPLALNPGVTKEAHNLVLGLMWQVPLNDRPKSRSLLHNLLFRSLGFPFGLLCSREMRASGVPKLYLFEGSEPRPQCSKSCCQSVDQSSNHTQAQMKRNKPQ